LRAVNYKLFFGLFQGSSTQLSESYIETFDELLKNVHKHGLSCSLLLMHKALSVGSGNKATAEQKKLLEVRIALEENVFTLKSFIKIRRYTIYSENR